MPALSGRKLANTIVLVGNAGPSLWAHFKASVELADGQEHPLDRYSSRCLEPIASRRGAHAVFPFEGPPYWPFQRWAKRCDGVWESPIGPLIHAEYGLWHAYRGAFIFPYSIDLPPRPPKANPCDNCLTKPCLSTCPVSALKDDRSYDVPACRDFLDGASGRGCLTLGCEARRACPIGNSYHYPSEQAEFHMRAFLQSAKHRGNE